MKNTTEKPSESWLNAELQKLANLFNAKLSPDAVDIHVDLLKNCSQRAIAKAFTRTQAEWTEASKFPPPSFILERVYAAMTALPHVEDMDLRAESDFDNTADRDLRVLENAVLKNAHPDFAGMPSTERQCEFQRMVLESQAAGNWGPEKQREAVDKLERFKRGEEVEAPWRNNDDPQDPVAREARRKKAHQLAIKHGWLEPERESGEEG